MKAIKVRTIYDKCPYITAGKVYEAHPHSEDFHVYVFRRDDGRKVWTRIGQPSAHLDNEGIFEIVPDGPSIADELADALEVLTIWYVDLVNSGDAGYWNPEEEDPVIQARAVLAKYKESKQ